MNSLVKVKLTEAGKTWLLEHYPQGVVWKYDPDKSFKLHSVATEFIALTCLGIPYQIPHTADGKPTIAKMTKKAE